MSENETHFGRIGPCHWAVARADGLCPATAWCLYSFQKVSKQRQGNSVFKVKGKKGHLFPPTQPNLLLYLSPHLLIQPSPLISPRQHTTHSSSTPSHSTIPILHVRCFSSSSAFSFKHILARLGVLFRLISLAKQCIQYTFFIFIYMFCLKFSLKK